MRRSLVLAFVLLTTAVVVVVAWLALPGPHEAQRAAVAPTPEVREREVAKPEALAAKPDSTASSVPFMVGEASFALEVGR